jgi:hypothetical protein
MSSSEDKALHKKFAITLFNQTWDLIDKEERSQEEVDRMIHAAHASRYHWEMAGTPLNIARGEWQVSHVYAILNRVEPCLYHAKRCLKVTLENGIKDFDLAFAYEAMARACDLAGDEVETAKYVELAKQAAAKIKDPQDREYFMSQLATIHQI